MKNNILPITILASSFLLNSMSSYAAQKTDYIGVNLGTSNYGTTSTYQTAATSVGVNSFEIDESDSGYKFFYGHKITPQFILELSYANFGEVTLNGSGVFQTVNFDLGLATEISTLAVQAMYQFNQDGVFKPFVKAGLHRWNLDAAVTVSAGNATASTIGNDTGSDVAYGLGFDIPLSDTLDIRAEYEMYKIDTPSIDEVSFVSVGLNYVF